MDIPAAAEVTKKGTGLTFVVVGASGDLAKKKIFPALFALYMEGSLGKVQPHPASPPPSLPSTGHRARANTLDTAASRRETGWRAC
jgi:hypothetical protein